MDQAPSARQYVFSALFLMLVGWGGLVLLILVYSVPPLVWARWGFFALWFIALTGTALPIVYFLNLRFPSEPRAQSNAIVRQAMWFGVYGATLAWLQLGQLATLWVWLGLAGGLVAIEYVIRSRERARWTPPAESDDPPAEDAHFVGSGDVYATGRGERDERTE
jgi:hypothetical protein